MIRTDSFYRSIFYFHNSFRFSSYYYDYDIMMIIIFIIINDVQIIAALS